MRSLLALLLATAAAVPAMAALPAPTPAPAPASEPIAGRATVEEDRSAPRQLAAELEGVIDGTGWREDQWSVLVVSLDGGDTIFAHQPGTSLMPASNLKLFTTAAALRYLGPDYRYSTYLTGTGPVRDGVLEGDLLVYGTGDPTLSARFFESKTAVWEALADSLAAAGVRRIAGDVVGDASYFEGAGVGEGWQTTYVTHTYAAPASALSFNDNLVTLRVKPGPSPGSKPEVQLIPGGRVQMLNEATTVASGRTHIRIKRDGYESPIVITGQVRSGDSGVWRAVPVVSPATYSASVLAEILAARGIQVGGAVRSVADATASPVTSRQVFAPTLEDGPPVQVLAVHRSPPLLEILKVINQRSHNLYAESVLRTVGRVATGSGSVKGGAAAVSALLKEAGGSSDATVAMDDGSGLSVLDRASASAIVELLAYMADRSPHWEEYRETLPEAATSRGLRRMQQTAAAGNLRAKTGTIDRVSALSGYVTARNGERLAFSIISNNVPSTWKAKRIEDRIGARLASFDRPVPVRRSLAASEDRGRGPQTTTPASPGAAPADGGAARSRADSAVVGADGSAPGRAVARARAGETGAANTEATRPDPARANADPPDRPETPAASPETYTIKKGDTLEGIAKRLGTTVPALQAANPGVNARRLMPGKTLRLPAN